MKAAFILLLTFSCLNCMYAQSDSINAVKEKKRQKLYANSIKFSAGDYSTRDVVRVGRPLTIHQIGISYERKIYGKWFANISYMKWKEFHPGHFGEFQRDLPLNDTVIGSLGERNHYKMLDLYLGYTYRPWKSRHLIHIAMGGAYTWGVNMYLISFNYNQAAIADAVFVYEPERVHYWGIVPQISYDYLLFRNRVAIGANVRARYYFGIPKAQHDFGFHAGVNF